MEKGKLIKERQPEGWDDDKYDKTIYIDPLHFTRDSKNLLAWNLSSGTMLILCNAHDLSLSQGVLPDLPASVFNGAFRAVFGPDGSKLFTIEGMRSAQKNRNEFVLKDLRTNEIVWSVKEPPPLSAFYALTCSPKGDLVFFANRSELGPGIRDNFNPRKDDWQEPLVLLDLRTGKRAGALEVRVFGPE